MLVSVRNADGQKGSQHDRLRSLRTPSVIREYSAVNQAELILQKPQPSIIVFLILIDDFILFLWIKYDHLSRLFLIGRHNQHICRRDIFTFREPDFEPSVIGNAHLLGPVLGIM